MNLKKKKFLYDNSTTQRCPKEIMQKNFMIEDFFYLLELRISPRIFEKIRNGRNDILRGLGIHEKNQKSKIS